MPRGGYRPGSGRKKGAIDKKPRKKYTQSPETEAAREEKRKIRELLSHDRAAKAKLYQEFLSRISRGETLSLPEKNLMGKLAAELSADLDDEQKPPPLTVSNTDAPDFLRQVWNDPTVEMALRIRAAEIICKGDGGQAGKKEKKKKDAEDAGKGRFAPGAAPKLAVVNK